VGIKEAAAPDVHIQKPQRRPKRQPKRQRLQRPPPARSIGRQELTPRNTAAARECGQRLARLIARVPIVLVEPFRLNRIEEGRQQGEAPIPLHLRA